MGAYGNNANDLRAYSRSPFFILGSSWSLFGNKTTIIVIIRAGINNIFIVNTEGDLLDVSTGTHTTYSQQVLFNSLSLSESSFIFIGIHFLNLFSLSAVNQTLPTYAPLIHFSFCVHWHPQTYSQQVEFSFALRIHFHSPLSNKHCQHKPLIHFYFLCSQKVELAFTLNCQTNIATGTHAT